MCGGVGGGGAGADAGGVWGVAGDVLPAAGAVCAATDERIGAVVGGGSGGGVSVCEPVFLCV